MNLKSLAALLVIAGSALAAVRAHQLSGDDPRIQPKRDELARPVVRTRTRLHRHNAARGQSRAPGHEVLSRQCAARQHALGRVHRMHLDHALGEIDPYTHGPFSGNLVHGLPLSQAAD